MRVFAVYNPLSTKRSICAWVHYEPGTDSYSIEIAPDAKPDELPLMLALFAECGVRQIEDRWARTWVERRTIHPGKYNLEEVLKAHGLDELYVPALFAANKGRSVDDDFLVEEVSSRNYHECSFEQVLDSPIDLGTQLSRARRAADLTQSELAELTGVQQAVISRIERGKGNPTLKTLELLAKGCKRSLHIELE